MEEDRHTAILKIFMAITLVDEILEFALAELLRALAENKEECIDHIGFATAVGSNHG